jgi:hypothetical protein
MWALLPHVVEGYIDGCALNCQAPLRKNLVGDLSFPRGGKGAKPQAVMRNNRISQDITAGLCYFLFCL